MPALKQLRRMSQVAAVAVVVAWTTPSSAQVPVTDAGNLFAQAKSFAQDIKGYALQGQQYLRQAQELSQAIQTYQNFAQNPSLGGAMQLMGQAGMDVDLPINPQQLMRLTSGYSMSLTGIGSKLGQLGNLANRHYDQNKVFECTTSDWACQHLRQNAYGIAGQQGIASSAYRNIQDHLPVIAALRERARTAVTSAERENVLVALASEQAWHDNMMGQLQAAQFQAGAVQESREQRDNEAMSRDFQEAIGKIPGPGV